MIKDNALSTFTPGDARCVQYSMSLTCIYEKRRLLQHFTVTHVYGGDNKNLGSMLLHNKLYEPHTFKALTLTNIQLSGSRI